MERYIVMVTKKVFSQSAQRMIDINSYFVVNNRKKADSLKEYHLQNPEVIKVAIFKEVLDG